MYLYIHIEFYERLWNENIQMIKKVEVVCEVCKSNCLNDIKEEEVIEKIMKWEEYKENKKD